MKEEISIHHVDGADWFYDVKWVSDNKLHHVTGFAGSVEQAMVIILEKLQRNAPGDCKEVS